MNLNSFRRKIIYISAIIVLLYPLYQLGQPSPQSGNRSAAKRSGGGTLIQLRNRHNIGQASLGELDPASETMRLATLGGRGFAACLLWNQAEYYKKEKYWDRYSATLNQIAILEPHFISVWEAQAHNLSYNISVEFDGYKQRYEWVKKGTEFLIRGTKLNERQPILEWHLGIYTGQKIGVADEKKQFRRLFRADEEYHRFLVKEGLDVEQNDAHGKDGRPDHWLVGRLWFERAYDLVEKGCYCKKSPHIFYSDGPKCWLRFSEAIEEEGVLDDFTQLSWNRAGNLWRDYGNRDVMTSWGHTVKLNGQVMARANRENLLKQFREISENVAVEVSNELKAKLSPEELAALDMPEENRNREQRALAGEAARKIVPRVMQIAERSPREIRDRVLDLATQFETADTYLNHLESYRNQVNYEYWETRATAEQLDITLDARRATFEADQLISQAKADLALEKYEVAWKNWAKVFARYPVFMTDEVAIDVMKSIRRYKSLLDSEPPEDFPLKDFVTFKEMYDKGGFDFEVEKMLEKWRRRAEESGGEIDFLNSEEYKKGVFESGGKAIPTEETLKMLEENEKALKGETNPEPPNSSSPAGNPTRPPAVENPAGPDEA